MRKIFVSLRDGVEKTLEGRAGLSLMEIMRQQGIGELLAVCGGSCSCATCHVFVDERFIDSLPKLESAEDDLLETSNLRKSNSRLACQIQFVEALGGMRITIAPEE